jgi:Tfp pilus assembly protein PilF
VPKITQCATNNLGNISVQANDTVAARRYFEEALKLEPNGEYAPEAKQALAKLKKK